jgi:ribonuclease T2
MIKSASLVVLLLSATAFADGVEQSQSAPTPGAFDTFVLSMGYHNDYCNQYSTAAECTIPNVAKGLGLHGLWPDKAGDTKHSYGYCDLPASKVKNWCDPAIDVKSRIPADEFAELAAIQPGDDTACLYNHEWYAHGACSQLSIADYFEAALTIAKRFQQLPATNALVKSLAGKNATRALFQQALESDLGANSASAVVLCRQDKSKGWHFSSFSVALSKTNYRLFPAAESFGQLDLYPGPDGKPVPDLGNCPDTGIIVSE